MARLTTLKPRIATLNTRQVQPLGETQRTRGGKWMRTRERILTRDMGLCQCDECKAAPYARAASEVDHRVPLWDGGSDDDANLQSMHPDCHERKTKAEAARRAGRR